MRRFQRQRCATRASAESKQTNKQAGEETDAPAERAHPEDLGDADGAAEGERALVHVRAHRGRREELAHAPLRTGRRAYGPSLQDNGDRYIGFRTVIYG